MLHSRTARRALALATGLAAAGAVSGAVASEALATTDLLGSGAAIQRTLHQRVWLPLWLGGTSRWTSTYTPTNAVAGFAEFGSDSGILDISQDTFAAALRPALYDGFTAVDSGPTGPAPGATFTPQAGTGTQLENAAYAANGLGSTSRVVTVPVAQLPLGLLLSLPASVTLPASARVNLTSVLAAELYAGSVPAANGWNAGTWEALLSAAGNSFTTTNVRPAGASLAGVQVRSDGAGATLNLKQYLKSIDATLWGGAGSDNSNSSASTDFPTGTTKLGFFTSDALEAQGTANAPGTVGYSTLSSAIAVTGGAFAETVSTSTAGGTSHQILWARLQDNTGHSPATFAGPAVSGIANVYTGARPNIGNGAGGVGNWVVPTTTAGGTTFDPTGTWELSRTVATRYSHGWDSDVFTNAADGNHYYPLSVALFVISWKNGGWNVGNLRPQGTNAEAATKDYLQFATSSAAQRLLLTTAPANTFYAPLPTGGSGLRDIRVQAALAAAAL